MVFYLSISFCFENGSADRSEQNLNEKVENKTSSSAFAFEVLQPICFFIVYMFSLSFIKEGFKSLLDSSL